MGEPSVSIMSLSSTVSVPDDDCSIHKALCMVANEVEKQDEIDDDDDDPWVYKGKRLQALNFPLGGFGTGNILLQGDGSLQGWTIQNQFHNPEYTPLQCLPGNAFAISAWYDDDSSSRESYLLQSAETYSLDNQNVHFREEKHVSQHQVRRLQHHHQQQQNTVLPGIPSLEMRCCYPIATVKYYTSTTFPIEVVEMEALTPLIPTNTKDSSYPVAVFTFRLTNRSPTRFVSVDLMQSTMNFIGWDGHSGCCNVGKDPTPFWGENINTPFVLNNNDDDATHCAGILLTSQRDISDVTRQGSITLAGISVPDEKTATRTKSSIRVIPGVTTEEELFHKFSNQAYHDPAMASPTVPSEDGTSYMGAVIQSITSIPPKTAVSCRFILSWYFPNRPCTAPREHLPKDIWMNQYSSWFTDSKDVLSQFYPRSTSLIETTRMYTETLYMSTIPYEVLESAAGRVATMRTPTIFWTKQQQQKRKTHQSDKNAIDFGIVLGNEGNDCCPLNCTHVYGYTTLLERLFPDIAKDMRISDFIRNFDPTKGCTMRFGQGGYAIDGNLANIIKAYLVVQQSDPKLEFLHIIWPNVQRQMDIVLTNFLDCDGIIRIAQQNTYDTAMLGANTFIGSYVITALKATAAMATLTGDTDYAKKCLKQAKATALRYEEICWREEYGYYIADVNETNCENSYGSGCFIDQLCAVGLSLACGFGTIFNPSHEATARKAILRNNVIVKPPFQDQQHHFYYGDAGIRVCTYPHGQLGKGMPYTNLVSSGFTYPVVAGMIYDGNWTDAQTICRMIRARQSGIHRSPWNEPECGLYYSRSMAGWNLFDQACGYSYDSTRGMIGFSPKINSTAFSCFCVFHKGFGQFEQKSSRSSGERSGDDGVINTEDNFANGEVRLRVLYGSLNDLRTIHLQTTAHVVVATINGAVIDDVSIDVGGIVTLATVLSIPAGSTLELQLSSPCSSSDLLSCQQGRHVVMSSLFINNIADVDDEQRKEGRPSWWYCLILWLLVVGNISVLMILSPIVIWKLFLLDGD
jgi:non-lysosomal glucosylceramidase